MTRPPNADDVGTFWLADEQVWQLISHCEYPTVTWQRVDDPSIRRGGAVVSPLAREFTRLLPEGQT